MSFNKDKSLLKAWKSKIPRRSSMVLLADLEDDLDNDFDFDMEELVRKTRNQEKLVTRL